MQSLAPLLKIASLLCRRSLKGISPFLRAPLICWIIVSYMWETCVKSFKCRLINLTIIIQILCVVNNIFGVPCILTLH